MFPKSIFSGVAIIFGTNPGSDVFSGESGDTQDSTEKNELPVSTELSVLTIFSTNLNLFCCWKYSKIFRRYRKYYEIIRHSVWADYLVEQILEPKNQPRR